MPKEGREGHEGQLRPDLHEASIVVLDSIVLDFEGASGFFYGFNS